MSAIKPPFEIFYDASGRPADNAKIYIGTEGQNPETAPVSVYWDEAQTIVAKQPLRTIAGAIYRGGNKAQVYGPSRYSIAVKSANDELYAYSASVSRELSSDDINYGSISVTEALDDAIKTVPNFAALSSTGGFIGDEVYLLGHTVAGLGGGYFIAKAATGLTADGGTVAIFGALAWVRESGIHITPQMFGAIGDGIVDDTNAFQAAVNYFQGVSAGYSTPYMTLHIPRGTYKIGQASGIIIAYDFDVMQLCFEADSGAKFVGVGTNYCFKFNPAVDPAGGGFRNIFKKLTFSNFSTVIRWHTNNRDQCSLSLVDCESQDNDVFIDTVAYSNSRSSLVKLESCIVNNTRVVIKHFTDHLAIKDCWFYAKDGSYDALLVLEGDGAVGVRDSFFIPNATPLGTPNNARFIDYICSGTAGDRSLKSLTVSNCRHSLEGARPFLWFYDSGTDPSGNNQVCSITLEDSYFGGTGGAAVVSYKQGYPGSVNFRNCKVFSCPTLVSIDAGNTNPPVPSVPGNLTYHVISVDEATRLSQSNTNNSASILDPLLEPFCYDTTSQTSKYKRSYKKNIDYRLPAMAAGAGRVKVSLPVFFDSTSSVSSRDIMAFLVVTVSDAGGPGFSNPAYRSQAVTLVSVIGGNSGSAIKRIVSTPLQDASGGIGFAYANNVSVFWGSADTGSADIVATSTAGTEDTITVAWDSTTPDVSWAYIVPLAGLRENQQDKLQYGVW